MPHSSCDPCCDPTGNSRGVDQYRSSVVQILCGILEALQNPTPPLERVTYRVNYTTAQTNTPIIIPILGSRIIVYRCSVLADKANTVDVAARVGFGFLVTPTAVGVVLSHPGIAAGSGVVEGSAAGILGYGASEEGLFITSEVPTSGSIDVVITYSVEAV